MDAYEGPAELYVNNRLQAEANKASTGIKGNNNEVFTMRKGLAGKSDGATTTDITVTSAIPKKGLEFDFRRAVDNKEFFTIVIKSGGTRMTWTGWFEDTQWDNAVDSATMIASTFKAGRPKFKGP
jgi:hypothetical protein